MSDTDPESSDGGDSKSRRQKLLRWLGGFLTAVLVALVGAFATPLGNNLFADKPIIPGAPTDKLDAGPLVIGQYSIDAEVAVRNRTVDPVQVYKPLNADDALPVRSGDILDFRLSCSIKPTGGQVKVPGVMLIIPSGLKIVSEPYLTTVPHPVRKANLGIEEYAWVWEDANSVIRDNADGGFTATVAVDKPVYLTVHWACTGFYPNNQPLPGLSRAVLKVN